MEDNQAKEMFCGLYTGSINIDEITKLPSNMELFDFVSGADDNVLSTRIDRVVTLGDIPNVSVTGGHHTYI